MIRITPDLCLDPKSVVSMAWDRRPYGGSSSLVLVLSTGTEYRIEHQPGTYGGVDAYAVEKSILEATK